MILRIRSVKALLIFLESYKGKNEEYYINNECILRLSDYSNDKYFYTFKEFQKSYNYYTFSFDKVEGIEKIYINIK